MSNDYIIGSLIPAQGRDHAWHVEFTPSTPPRAALPVEDESVFGEEEQGNDLMGNITLYELCRKFPDVENPGRNVSSLIHRHIESVLDLDVADDGVPGFIPDYRGETGLLIFPLCDDISDWVITGKHTLEELAARNIHYWHQDGEFVGHWDAPEGVDQAGVVSVSLDALASINPRYLNGHVVSQFIGDAIREAVMSIGAPDIDQGWFGHVDDEADLDAMRGRP